MYDFTFWGYATQNVGFLFWQILQLRSSWLVSLGSSGSSYIYVARGMTGHPEQQGAVQQGAIPVVETIF
jgi:hypothetical protein